MRHIQTETRRFAGWAVLVLPCLVALGCDRPLPLAPEVPVDKQILMLVADLDDYSQVAKEREKVKQLFAPGSTPSKEALARYSAYRYEGKPPVRSGDSATVTVVVKDVKTNNPVGEVQWSMTKVNGSWWLKEAPLP